MNAEDRRIVELEARLKAALEKIARLEARIGIVFLRTRMFVHLRSVCGMGKRIIFVLWRVVFLRRTICVSNRFVGW